MNTPIGIQWNLLFPKKITLDPEVFSHQAPWFLQQRLRWRELYRSAGKNTNADLFRNHAKKL
jgi:hypothetical protein